jgi:[acyl-carrier-protein] S-malonyltransferase
MGLALLFSGQGTQHAAMLPWLDAKPAAAPLLARMCGHIGADWRRRAEDPQWLTQNRVAQPLLTGVQLAAWQCLAAGLRQPVAVAGYSVGELAAFAAAGTLTPEAAIDLATSRAEAMDEAIRHQQAGMAAVRDIPMAQIESWCERHGLAVAIRLAPDRAIVGGMEPALAQALSDAALARARVDRLAVRVPSHTHWMQPAVPVFAAQLQARPLQAPTSALVCNLTGTTASRPAELARCLAGQIASVVRWDQCMATVSERGARCVLEIGPGTALAAMWRERYPAIPARSVDEFRSAAAVTAWVQAQAAD